MSELLKSYLRSALKTAGAALVTSALTKYGASAADLTTVMTGGGGAAAVLAGLIWSHYTHKPDPNAIK